MEEWNPVTKNLELSRPRRLALLPSAASLTGALAAALVPQGVDAALVTVGGDGGIGTVTLENLGDSTDLGGLLLDRIVYSGFGDHSLRMPGLLGSAYRSNVGVGGNERLAAMNVWRFDDDYGAVLNSSDNWLPGRFRVNGVNGGNPIWGWLQVGLGGSRGSFNPTIVSFTYDDEATDDLPFEKPVGGFSLTDTEPVPEPSTLGLFGLGLGAAFVSRMRRRKKEGGPAVG